MTIEGATFAIVGALEAFPRRLAAREIRSRGGELRRGLSRQTRFAVFGHRLIEGSTPEKILARIREVLSTPAMPLSENTFLRLLGVMPEPPGPREFSSRQIVEQSGLDREAFERLLLFDAFESGGDPFGFRDLVAARQYAKLGAEGVDWLDIVRAIRTRRRSGSEGVSNVRLARSGRRDLLVQTGATVSELNGQLLLGLPEDDPERTDRLFEEAAEAEVADDWDRAVVLYRRCLESEPADPVVAFNLSHALLKSGEWREARRYLNKVLKLDPNYAEAWYNLASIARDQKDYDSAKRHLRRAIAADPGYPDPLYNLALLEFDGGDYAKATKLWQRYLELDPGSAWGQKARYGLQLIGMITGTPGEAGDIKTASEQLRVVR